MLLDKLAERNVDVYSVGKIFDVFLGRGIGGHVTTKSNADGMTKTLEAMQHFDRGLIFINLVDFDQQYGHRNDVEGYAKAIEEFDRWLPEFRAAMRPGDLAILTADHGCDPTTPSTDHSREYTPLIVFGPHVKAGSGSRAESYAERYRADRGGELRHVDRARDQFPRSDLMSRRTIS